MERKMEEIGCNNVIINWEIRSYEIVEDLSFPEGHLLEVFPGIRRIGEERRYKDNEPVSSVGFYLLPNSDIVKIDKNYGYKMDPSEGRYTLRGISMAEISLRTGPQIPYSQISKLCKLLQECGEVKLVGKLKGNGWQEDKSLDFILEEIRRK